MIAGNIFKRPCLWAWPFCVCTNLFPASYTLNSTPCFLIRGPAPGRGCSRWYPTRSSPPSTHRDTSAHFPRENRLAVQIHHDVVTSSLNPILRILSAAPVERMCARANTTLAPTERELGPGQFTARAMFSLEPATVTSERYPLLFQQGETAYGVPIADGQHPHDFFMELAVLYDVHLGECELLSFYVAPVGDPAIGPTAYPHRASASENPVGTLGHLLESTLRFLSRN